MKCFSILTFLLAILAGKFCFGQSQALPPARHEPSMQAELETVYNQWRAAMLVKNVKAWENSVAMYRRNETRNRIVSQKQPFPQALFDSQIEPPTLGNLTFLSALTRRDTASAVYFGKPNFGVDNPNEIRNVLLVLRFLKEGGVWRFDNNRIVRLGQNTDVLHQLRLGQMDFLKGPEFQPLDEIPAIPQPVKAPELIAEAWVRSIGFETEIFINGHRLGKIKDNIGKELVPGGVSRGNNRVQLRVKKIKPAAEVPHRLEIAIYAAANPGEKADKVFQFGPLEEVPALVQTGFSGRKPK